MAKKILSHCLFLLIGYSLAVLFAGHEESVNVRSGHVKSTYKIFPFKMETSRDDTAFEVLYGSRGLDSNKNYSIITRNRFFSLRDRKSSTIGSTIILAEKILVRSFDLFDISKESRSKISKKFNDNLRLNGYAAALKYAAKVWEKKGRIDN